VTPEEKISAEDEEYLRALAERYVHFRESAEQAVIWKVVCELEADRMVAFGTALQAIAKELMSDGSDAVERGVEKREQEKFIGR